MFCYLELKELWNTTAVDSIDESKIEEHLKKQGISSMEDLSLKHVSIQSINQSSNQKSFITKINICLKTMTHSWIVGEPAETGEL